MPANRWQAFLIHLGICAVLFVVLLYLIVFHWYPQPYFAADGGWQGIQIITGVDLILGPVLTLMVYRRGKRELKSDLALIAAFQTVALVWGTWLVYDQRTAAVVYSSKRFQTLTIDQVKDAGERAVRMVSEATTHPPYIVVPMPTDKKERLKLVAEATQTRIPLTLRGDRYEFIDANNRTSILESGIDVERRVEGNVEDRAALEAFLAKYGGRSDDYAFVPLSCRYRFLLLALNRKDGTVVGALNIRPTVRFTPPQTEQP